MRTDSLPWLAGIVLLPVLFGCPAGQAGSEGALDGTAGDDGTCVEPMPVDFLPSNPNFKNVTTGLAAPPSGRWQSIALGHVDDIASSTSCCEDYVLGSDISSTLSVVLNAPANGLVVFEDQPHVELSAGGAVADVTLADLDGDDRNDLVALLLDGRLSVRFGTDTSPFFANTLSRFSTAINGSAGRDQLVAVDIDCDGAVDVLMPTDSGIIIMLNDGSGTVSPMSVVPSLVPLERLAVGDLDHDDDVDIVASASDGSAQVWLGNCGNFATSDVYGVLAPPGTYDETRVAFAVVCPSSNTSLDMVISYGDTVDVYCGNGSGNFSNVQEAHGEETVSGADFQWRPGLAFADPRYSALAVVGAGQNQQVLGLDINDNKIVSFVPSNCSDALPSYFIALPYSGAVPSPLSRLVATRDPSAWESWERLAMVGGAGLQVMR